MSGPVTADARRLEERAERAEEALAWLAENEPHRFTAQSLVAVEFPPPPHDGCVPCFAAQVLADIRRSVPDSATEAEVLLPVSNWREALDSLGAAIQRKPRECEKSSGDPGRCCIATNDPEPCAPCAVGLAYQRLDTALAGVLLPEEPDEQEAQSATNRPTCAEVGESAKRAAPPAGYIVPEGDERCRFTMDACQCMKRKGHDGLHGCAHGGWR